MLFGFASVIAHAIAAIALSTILNSNKEIIVSSLDSYKPLLVTMNSAVKSIPVENQQTNDSVIPVSQPASTEITVAPQLTPAPDLSTKAYASNDSARLAEANQPKTRQSTLLTLNDNRNIEVQDTVALNQHTPDIVNRDAKNAMIHEKLNALVKKNFRYPGFAVKRGWEGTVKLGLRIEANGRLSHVRVIKTSGHSILDQAALTTLSKTSYIYGLEVWLAGNYFDTTLPVQYQLIDG